MMLQCSHYCSYKEVTAMSASSMNEVVRVRIDADKKASLTRMYSAKQTTISEAVRRFLDEELERDKALLDRFDAVMQSADEQAASYGAPEPTIDDIVSYVDRMREQRAHDSAA